MKRYLSIIVGLCLIGMIAFVCFTGKKEENDFSLSIGERLTQGKEAYRIAKKSRSTINMVNKNRYGLTYDKINKKIL